ncbi:MAG: MATE family efflux transporter [Verrucomicrobiota bacterium]
MSEIDRTQKTLFQLSWPLLLTALSGMIVMLVDTMIISSYSETAAASVSLANQILLVAFDLSAFFAAGSVVMISRKLGSKEPKEAERFAEASFVGNALLGFLLGVIIMAGAPWWVAALNCPDETVVGAEIYLRVGGFTIIFNGMMMAGTAMLRGYGETRIMLVLGITAQVAYLILAYVLILGMGPIPSLGVLGSSLATFIIRVAAVIALLIVLAKRLSFFPTFWKRTYPDFLARAKPMFQLGWPLALDNLAYGFYQMLLVSFIAGMGVTMVLSRSFTWALSTVLTVLLMSLSQANEVMIGYRYGAKKWDELTRCMWKSSVVAIIVTTLGAIILASFAKPLLGLFTKDPKIIQMGQKLLWITVFAQPFSAVNTVLYFSSKTIGDVLVPVAGTQIMMWCISVPIAYLFAVTWGLGVIGLWYVLLMEEALKAVFLSIRWWMYYERRKHLLELN